MNLFDLAAKITLDTHSYEAGIKSAVSMGRTASETVINFVGNVTAIGTEAAKAMGTAAAAGTAGIAALTKSAVVDYYGEAEQLIGGVETLFKDSSDIVIDYANSAYKTAGISANEYMTTVTSFSASLLKSLDGDTRAAANYADMAITDMADNANKMGTSMESIQNAYQGFAKQNYTMLDNLKLGYGGTKAEMKRLIKDAEKISGKDLSIKNYSDIIEAIHIIQEDMGITGTTAKEASATIQGSMSSAKSAIKNLMVGIADENADLEKLTGNVVETVSAAAGNILPRVKITLDSLMNLVNNYSDDAVNFAADTLADLTKKAPQAAKLAGNTLKNMLSALTSGKEDFKAGAWTLFETLIDGFEAATDELVPLAEDLTPLLAKGVLRFQTSMFSAGIKIVGAFLNGLLDNGGELAAYAKSLISNLGKELESDKNLTGIPGKALAFINSFLSGIANEGNLDKLIPGALAILGKLATEITDPENLSGIFGSAVDILKQLALGLISEENLTTLEENVPIIISNIGKFLTNAAVDLTNAADEIIIKFCNFLTDANNIKRLNGIGQKLAQEIVKGIFSIGAYTTMTEENADRFMEGLEMMFSPKTFGTGLFEMGSSLMTEFFNGIEQGIGDGLDSLLTGGNKERQAMIIEAIPDAEEARAWGKDMIDNFVGGIKSGWDKLKGAVSDTAQKIKDILGFSEPKEGPLSDFHTYAPDMMDLFIQGVKDNEKKLTDQIEDTFDFGERTIDLAANGGYIATVEQDDTVLAKSSKSGGISGVGGNVTININVDGANYEDETALAEEIARVLQKLFERREAAYA